MSSIFKFTACAFAVSVVLSGCKSNSSPAIVAQDSDKQQLQLTPSSTTTKPAASTTAKPTEVPKPVTVVNPVETTKPVETAKPAETVKPAEAIKPVAIVNPVETTKPVETAKPAETVKPAEAIKPVTAVNPVETTKPVETAKPAEAIKPVEIAKPTKTGKPAEPVNPTVEAKPAENKEPKGITTLNPIQHLPVKEDRYGKLWRVIPLLHHASLIDASEQRLADGDHFVSHETLEADSPFSGDEDEKPYNALIVLDLGENDKANPTIISLKAPDADYLGKHSGQWQDKQIAGSEISLNEDNEVTASHPAQKLHYRYVNQPYSSYGAVFTNENDSRLFHLRLTTGRDGKKQLEEGSGENYAEYGVFRMEGKNAVWQEGLVGDAVYRGEVIARTEQHREDKTTPSLPDFDGQVTLNLHLSNDWEKSRISGQIDSKTLGVIPLSATNLPPARYLSNQITFNGETSTSDYNGFYTVGFAGENLNDAVGNIELEANTDTPDNGISKYNAVFGAVKSEK